MRPREVIHFFDGLDKTIRSEAHPGGNRGVSGAALITISH